MLPKTPIAWRRRVRAKSDAIIEIGRVAYITEAHVHALEAWAWGGPGKAPSRLQGWIDGRIAEINATADAADPLRAGAVSDGSLVAVVMSAIARDIASNTGPIWAALREHRRDDPKAGA